MKRIRFIGLAIVAVFALSAVAASAASAHNFKAEIEKVKVKASTFFGAVDHFQGFQASNAVSVCKKGTFAGEGTSGSETLEVHPEYSECSAALSGTNAAEVNTEGCNYVFHAAAPSTTQGTVDIKCSGEGIKVKIPALSCEIVVPSQTVLVTIEYVNEGTGNARKVLVRANVTGIKYKSNCAAITVKEGATAEYRAGKFSAGLVPEMAAGPAEALSEGRNSLNQPVGVWVE